MTDDLHGEARRVIDYLKGLTGIELTEAEVIEAPQLFIGSIDRFVEKFESLRERLGITSILLGRVDELAPGRRAARRELRRASARDRDEERAGLAVDDDELGRASGRAHRAAGRSGHARAGKRAVQHDRPDGAVARLVRERGRIDESTKRTGLDPLHGRRPHRRWPGRPARLRSREIWPVHAATARPRTARITARRRVMPQIVSDVRHTGVGRGPDAGSR